LHETRTSSTFADFTRHYPGLGIIALMPHAALRRIVLEPEAEAELSQVSGWHSQGFATQACRKAKAGRLTRLSCL